MKGQCSWSLGMQSDRKKKIFALVELTFFRGKRDNKQTKIKKIYEVSDALGKNKTGEEGGARTEEEQTSLWGAWL